MTKVTVIIYESDEALIERYITELSHTSFEINTRVARDLHSFLILSENSNRNWF